MINYLGLIKYYSEKYDKLYLFTIKINLHLLNFFCKQINIKLIIVDNQHIDPDNLYNYIIQNYNDIMNNSDYLFHGFYDVHRKDIYKNVYQDIWFNNRDYFVSLIYLCYNIDPIVRINSFIFERDYELENRTYDNFVKENGDQYILCHFNNDSFMNKTCNQYKYINLNKSTEIFFDYIKILENAKEFHILDSCWGAFIYLLDCKYRLFKDKTIFLYSLRNYRKMFQHPIQLENWVFVQ